MAAWFSFWFSLKYTLPRFMVEVPKLPRMGMNNNPNITIIMADAMSLSLAMPLLSGSLPKVFTKMKNSANMRMSSIATPNTIHHVETDASASFGELKK